MENTKKKTKEKDKMEKFANVKNSKNTINFEQLIKIIN
jgi:hypothetical protein